MRTTYARGSLASRVIASAVASAAIAGTLAAISAVLAVDRLVSEHGDRRLMGAATILAGEIDEETVEGEWEPLGDVVADENGELVTSGVRLAVFSSLHRIAGDPWVPLTRAGECSTHGLVGDRVRACAHAHGDWVLVAASATDDSALRSIYILAAFGALLVAGALGAIASVRLTRWALAPLDALTRQIRALRPDTPDANALAAPVSCEEVDAIRKALSELVLRVHALLDQASRFAADAAHELRTPLTTIRGELDLLAEQTQDAQQQAALERAARRTVTLSALVERLLLLASPVQRDSFPRETIALHDLVEQVVATLPPAQRERVVLALHDEGLVRGEPTLLASMVTNALDNALKFSGEKPVTVTLHEGWSVCLEVRDEGPGIEPSERTRVFAPFYRIRPDATEGHGLGLALIGHIARAHGGRAEIVDTERGACLRVSLPPWSPDAGPAKTQRHDLTKPNDG